MRHGAHLRAPSELHGTTSTGYVLPVSALTARLLLRLCLMVGMLRFTLLEHCLRTESERQLPRKVRFL